MSSGLGFDPDELLREARRQQQRNQQPRMRNITPGGNFRIGCPLPLIILAAVIVILVLLLPLFISFWTDLQWYDSLGFGSVYTTRLWARVGLFFAAAIFFFIALAVNLNIARMLWNRQSPGLIRPEVADYLPLSNRLVSAIIWIGSAAVAILAGLSISSQWTTVLSFLNATAFGARDAVFNEDVGFYVFTLPMYRLVQSWVMGALIVSLIGIVIYGAYQRLGLNTNIPRSAWTHASLLGAGILGLIAWGYYLSRLELVYSERGPVLGATYTDVNVQQGVFWLLIVIALATAVALVVAALTNRIQIPGIALGVWILAVILAGNAYPAIVQQFQVKPNELARETPYIDNNIKATREAFNLTDKTVQTQEFPAESQVSTADLQNNQQTVNDIRLWDYNPLLTVYNQIQAIQPYYNFADVDVDRYRFPGQAQSRQVMVSARELVPDQLPPQAQTWVNRHLQYTHGYGLAMSPVNAVVGEGLPELFVRDFPVQNSVGLKIDRPQVYYGEKTTDFVIVNTAEQEFDYPAGGGGNTPTKYTSDRGVKLDSFLSRLAYAWRFGDGNILFSGAIQDQSKILFNREIRQRVKDIAPFLLYDTDPYLVVADGQLWWIQDAYTTTDRYPNAQRYSVSQFGNVNYIRNSVKIVTSAYDGSIKFYVADKSDPIIQTYQKVFPVLFAPLDEMSPELRAHIRYPETLFRIQSDMYRTYHMTDVRQFYNRDDLWAVPQLSGTQGSSAMEPYYVTLKIPGESKEEFALIRPFTPNNRENMVSWLAARIEGENYGKLVDVRLPRDRQFYGPSQIDARLNQDPTISQQFTLLGQRGSMIIRGNLLVIPIEKSFLYVVPLYIQAEQGGRIPELKRVVVADASRVTIGNNLGEALDLLTKAQSGPTTPGTGTGQPGATPTATPSATPTGSPQATPTRAPAGTPSATAPAGTPVPTSPEVQALIRSAQDHYNRAQEALKAGDFARYGEEIKALQADLDRLAQLTGTTPSAPR